MTLTTSEIGSIKRDRRGKEGHKPGPDSGGVKCLSQSQNETLPSDILSTPSSSFLYFDVLIRDPWQVRL